MTYYYIAMPTFRAVSLPLALACAVSANAFETSVFFDQSLREQHEGSLLAPYITVGTPNDLAWMAVASRLTALSPKQRPERNSFINKQADTVPQLVAQIKTDPQVADRFMRHFSMTKQEVIDYVSKLKVGTLQPGRYLTVYSVPDNGVIKSHVSFFKTGTPVFMDRDGSPVLRLKCGNPFVRGPVEYSSTEANIIDESEAPTYEQIEDIETGADPTDLFTAEEPGIPERPLIADSVALKEADNIEAQSFVPAAVGFNPSILGLGALTTFTRSGTPTPVVPEPASVIAIGIGAVALLRRKISSKS